LGFWQAENQRLKIKEQNYGGARSASSEQASRAVLISDFSARELMYFLV
jgi:hypothetical protein